jgi:hypothetical protein
MPFWLALTACSPFEGTWLMLPDLATYDLGGDCADEDDVEYSGTQGDLFDIYRLGRGDLAVLVGNGIALVGTPQASTLTAVWEESVDIPDSKDTDISFEFFATLAGDEMTGSWAYESDSAAGSCDLSFDFIASRITSSRDAYVSGGVSGVR